MNNNFHERHARTISLIGEQALARLQRATVAVVGLGGVGGFAAEALARSGVGTLIVIDGDAVAASNLNRQIFALWDNVGESKAAAAQQRLRAIDPSLTVHAKAAYLNAENASTLLTPAPDVIVDAIDRMADKLALIRYAHDNAIPILSAGGAGNRLSPRGMVCADVFETRDDPLCRIMRRELRRMDIKAHRVVAVPGAADAALRPPGSMAFVPGVMGLTLAQEAVRMIVEGGEGDEGDRTCR